MPPNSKLSADGGGSIASRHAVEVGSGVPTGCHNGVFQHLRDPSYRIVPAGPAWSRLVPGMIFSPGKNAVEKAGWRSAEWQQPLSPAQWLPKPATSQLPKLGRALRAKWSPLVPRGARVTDGVQAAFMGGNRRQEKWLRGNRRTVKRQYAARNWTFVRVLPDIAAYCRVMGPREIRSTVRRVWKGQAKLKLELRTRARLSQVQVALPIDDTTNGFDVLAQVIGSLLVTNILSHFSRYFAPFLSLNRMISRQLWTFQGFFSHKGLENGFWAGSAGVHILVCGRRGSEGGDSDEDYEYEGYERIG
jgi:hypothetical protein